MNLIPNQGAPTYDELAAALWCVLRTTGPVTIGKHAITEFDPRHCQIAQQVTAKDGGILIAALRNGRQP
jgi:hypothetical protein